MLKKIALTSGKIKGIFESIDKIHIIFDNTFNIQLSTSIFNQRSSFNIQLDIVCWMLVGC